MTLASFLGGSPGIVREPPTMADNLENYYGAIDRGGHGWKTKVDMKKTKSTLSALTLLAFLFFLNLLLSCLKETLQGSDPEIIVVPQQRVTRRVSGQLIGLVGPMGDTGAPAVPVQAADPVVPVALPAKPDLHQITVLHEEDFTAKGGQRFRAGNRTKRSVQDSDSGAGDSPAARRAGRDLVSDLMTIFLPPLGTTLAYHSQPVGEASAHDYETSIETPQTLRDVRGEEDQQQDVDDKTLGPLEYMDVEPEYLGWETVEDVNEDLNEDEDVNEDENVSDTTLPTYDVTPSTSNAPEQHHGASGMGSDEESITATSEAPTTLPNTNELNTRGNEHVLELEEQRENTIDDCNDSVECEVDNRKDTEDSNTLSVSEEEEEEAGDVPDSEQDTAYEEQDEGSAPAEKPVAASENVLWEDFKALWTGLTMGVAGKGWQESLDSLQHPGVGLWNIGEQMLKYSMPILRDATLKFGFDPARCKELVVCETSRLAWMMGDRDVTSAFDGVFEWLYGMEEPEVRSITREWRRKKKKSCRNYIRRCKVEAGEESWLPMIANVLEYFVT